MAVDVFNVWKVSGGHGHPFQFAFHMTTPWWVWKNILISRVIFPSSPSVLLHLVGVVWLCGRGLTSDCKRQS